MFRNDYCRLAADEVLQALAKQNGKQKVGYGLDGHSAHAEQLILKMFGLTEEDASVYFLTGGTQTNMVVISYLLRPYEAVIACDTAHINVHETGAVEASGHKILTAAGHDGKLCPKDIDVQMSLCTDEHLVKPALVYITQATETGTVYTDKELQALRSKCDEYRLPIFMDGARLGAALTSGADVTAEVIAGVCDAFYVGGTKNGALAGEAVVLKKHIDRGDFRYHVKNRGALLAKGYFMGIQFETLFADGLYLRLAQRTNETAAYIREGLTRLGVDLVGGSITNQIFARFPRQKARLLIDRYGTEIWTDEGEDLVIRFVTDFGTKLSDCEELISYIEEMLK